MLVNKKIKGKLILPFFILGLMGLLIEVFFTAITKLDISLKGNTSLWMILVYGLAGIIISILNENKKIYTKGMRFQTLLYGSIILAIEFASGILFNIIFKLELWSYNGLLNIYNQIDLPHTICWYIGIPFFIWLIDIVSWALYREEWFYNVFDNYKELFKK